MTFRMEKDSEEDSEIEKNTILEGRNTRIVTDINGIREGYTGNKNNSKDNNNDNNSNNNYYEDVDDKNIQLSRQPDNITLEFTGETDISTNYPECPTELGDSGTEYSASSCCRSKDSFRQMIVLFDNSYSWYRAKELR